MSAPSGSTKNDDALRAAANAAMSNLLAMPLAAGLYLVATPLGNLGDITLRALAVLTLADLVYCEDTRHSAKLLNHYGIAAKTRPLHEHNEDAETNRAVSELLDGKVVALISDGGTPIISDPGFRLVRASVESGISVFSIPGASAVITAIAASALPADAFFFAGFLPPKEAARRARLAEIMNVPGSLIFYEAPHRLRHSLTDMAEVLGNRAAVVARELTKMHEEIRRGTLRDLAEAVETEIKGEIVVIVDRAPPGSFSDEMIANRLEAALESMTLKDASRAIATELGISKSRVYDIGLKAKGAKP